MIPSPVKTQIGIAIVASIYATVIVMSVAGEGVVAFVALDVNKQWDMYIINDDGEGIERLTQNAEDERYPSWSSNAKQIVYATNSGKIKIYSFKDKKSEEINLPTEGNGEPAWNPKADKIAYISYPPVPNRKSALWITELKDGNWIAECMQITSKQKGFPTWTTDGKKIVMAMLDDIKEDGPIEGIWSLDIESTELFQLVENYDNINPAFSPDGKKLAFTSNRSGNYDIYLRDENEAELRRLTKHPGYDGDPSWSPDGSQIVFVSSRSGHRELWLYNINTYEEKQLTCNDTETRDPVYCPVSREQWKQTTARDPNVKGG